MDPPTASASPCALGKLVRSEHADATLDQASGSDSASSAAAAASASTGSAAPPQSQRQPQPQPKPPQLNGGIDHHTDEAIREAHGEARDTLHAALGGGAASATGVTRTSDDATMRDAAAQAQVESTCATALSAFLRLQQRDPAVCAAVLQHICQTAPHLLRAQPAPTTHASAASAASTLHQPLEAESSAARQVRMDRLRDSALVTGTIALALSFLPLAERLELGRVSRGWHGATRQTSLWRDAGWRFDFDSSGGGDSDDAGSDDADSDDADSDSASQSEPESDSDILPLPAWLWSSLGHIDCTHTCLMEGDTLPAVGAATAAHHLSIRFDEGRSREVSTVSTGDIRRTLHPLRLLSLTADCQILDKPSSLAEAINGLPDDASIAEEEEDHEDEEVESDVATGTDPEPLSPSLVGQPLLHHWAPTLTALHLHSIRPSDQLLAVLTDLQWPSLRSLFLQFQHRYGPAVLHFAVQLLEALVSAQHPPPLAKLLLHVDVDYMRKTAQSTDFPPLTRALLAALERMPGIAELDVDFALGLTEEQPDGWLPGLHLLPALRVLRCDFNLRAASGRAFLQSVAMAPRLEELQLLTNHDGTASAMCAELQKQWTAARDASSKSSSSMGRLSRAGPVMLRELHFPAKDSLGKQQLQSLATLPHLERLCCRVPRRSLVWLGGLRGLRSLTLPDVDWKDADVRLLAELPLPLLSTLELLPRPNWSRHCGYGGRMAEARLTVSGSLRYLLQLPPLSRLRLPLLSPHTRTALNTLLVHSGRSTTLRVEVEVAEEEEDDHDDDSYRPEKPPSLFLGTCTDIDEDTAASSTIVLNDV